jgi:hypothetical protein
MVREGQGLEDIEAHHGANVGVLEQDYFPLSSFDLRCSFRSRLFLVVVAGRRFRSPAGAAARVVAEGLVLRFWFIVCPQ